MTEREREEMALFRYGIVSEFIQSDLPRGEQKRLLVVKAGRRWQAPGGRTLSVTVPTLKNWIRRCRREGVDGLKPRGRRDKGQCRALAEPVQKLLLRMRAEHPEWTVPEILRQVRQAGLVEEEEALPLSTVYRLIGKAGREAAPRRDRRKFEFEAPLECVQADVMYGPRFAGPQGQKRRAYLHVLLDDATRLVLHGEFLDHERVTAFERVLKTALLRRGHVPERLYTDNGAAFVSHHLQMIAARLGMRLLRTEPGVPEGRGKIERFFRRVREQFLVPNWRDGMGLEELNRRFWEWVELEYHRRPHQGLDGESPLEKWARLSGRLARRPRAGREQLDDLFRHCLTRRVGADRTFRVKGLLFEAPVELIRERVDVLFAPDRPGEVEIRQGTRSFGTAKPVDPHVNRRVRRGIRFDRGGDRDA